MTASGCWQDADELKWAVRSWEARIGVKVSQIYLRKMSQKWASISTSGRLTLNSELLELPKELGEFVIVHEILHIIAPNHGKVLKASCLHISQIGVRGKSSYRAVKMERIRSRPI